MKFLEREREAVARLAEHQPRQRKLFEGTKLGDRGKGATHFGTGQKKTVLSLCFPQKRYTQVTVQNVRSSPSVWRVDGLNFSNN